MTSEIRRLIRVREDKNAYFKRDGYGKKKQLSSSWRKPRGQHNKQRRQKKAKGALPKPGFGSPVAIRGMHPSGFFEILIATQKDLGGYAPKIHAVRISSTLGNRKRTVIQEAALAAGFKVLNARAGKTLQETMKAPEKEPSPPEKVKTEETNVKKTKAPVKKESTVVKPVPSKAPKKAQVEPAKKSSKPNVVKTEEKKENDAVKESKKTEKKSAKPKNEKTKAASKAKTKAEPASKPRAKKKTASEVKKND